MADLGTRLGKTLNHHGRRLARGWRTAFAAFVHPRIERPVFILGCSRGGTTLVYKLFSQARELGSLGRETHDDWAALHPLAARDWRSHTLGAADARADDRRTMERLFYIHAGRRRIVDKNNQAGFAVPYLAALFPDAFFVHVVRNPGDTLASLIEGWGRPEAFGSWARELPARVAIEAGRYTRWCFFLPEGWRAYTERPIAEVCAFQYAAIHRAILDARADIAPERWVTLPYEALLADPPRVLGHAFAACGLSFGSRVRSRIEDAMRVPYNAFSPIGVDKWRSGPHAERIARVLPGLADMTRTLGYDAVQI